MLPILLFFISVWYLSLFAQSFFQHRYAAHGAFRMSRGWERFFFIYAYIAQGSSYLSPRAYAIMHRMHHAYTDTEKDPHSPNFSSNIFSMMVRTRNIYQEIYHGRMVVEDRFLKNLPEWSAFDKFASSMWSRGLWVLLYLSVFILYAPSPWLYILLPFIVIMGPLHGAIINWFAHKLGYRNFRVKNTSRNLLSVDILMLGESYHNNHHKRPSAVNFGYKWHELDPIYPIILLLHKLKIIKICNQGTANKNPDSAHQANLQDNQL